MKLFSTPALYHFIFLIQVFAASEICLASARKCQAALWAHAGRSVCSSQNLSTTPEGLRLETCESKKGFHSQPLEPIEPPWLRQSREINLERALAEYKRRKFPPDLFPALRKIAPLVAPYSRWINIEDAQAQAVGGLSLVASEWLCVRHEATGASRCSGSWDDFEWILTNPKAWDELTPLDPLALELVHPGVQVPRIPQRHYSFAGFSFSFNRVYEFRNYFLKRRHPLRDKAREELVFTALEWFFQDFSNNRDDLFRWPPPGFEVPSIFSYGDPHSVALYGPLSLVESHDWSNQKMGVWKPLSGTPMEMLESLFLWPGPAEKHSMQSDTARARLRSLRKRYFPPEEVFVDPRGVVLRSDLFEVRAAVLKQSNLLNPAVIPTPVVD